MSAHRQETSAQHSGPEGERFREIDWQRETKRAARKGRAESVSCGPDSQIDEVELVILLAEGNSLPPTAFDRHDEHHARHRCPRQIDSQLHDLDPNYRLHATEVRENDHYHAEQYH